MKIGLHASRFHTCRSTCSWPLCISPWHNSRSRGQCLIGIVITDCKRSATSFQIQTGSGSCSMVNDLLTNDKDLSCRCGNELTREPIFSLFSSQISPPDFHRGFFLFQGTSVQKRCLYFNFNNFHRLFF